MKGGTGLFVIAGLGIAAFLLARGSSDSSTPTPAPDSPPPDPSTNPGPPAGWQYMPQSMVTPAMTAWAVSILNDTDNYPMFSTATQTFGTQPVLAMVEWHVPDFIKNYVHRGVSLCIPSSQVSS